VRPLRLEIEGFATFRSPTVLDFDDLDLVAFVGPTGAGKSTLIDAMTFALYGSVARYDNANVVAPVIHQLSTEAKVRFDFEIGGTQYAAVRVVRRRASRTKSQDATTGGASAAAKATTGATTKEARLELLVNGQSADVLAGNVRELDAAIVELVGLDFGQFTRTVVLPQGAFAQFLKDEPASRQRLLRSLLDLDIYARMGVVARETAKSAATTAETLEAELTRQGPVADDHISGLTARVESLIELRSAIETQLQELAIVDESLAPLRQRVNELDESRHGLDAVAVPDGLAAETDDLSGVASRLEAATERVAALRVEWESTQEALAAAPDRGSLMTLLAQFDQAAQATQDLANAETECSRYRADSGSAEAGVETARQRLADARTSLSEARLAADAEVWVAKLVEGEPCPVCLQVVQSVPDHSSGDAVAHAEAVIAEGEAALSAATTACSTLKGQLQLIEAESVRLTSTVKELASVLDGVERSDVVTRVDELTREEEASRATLGRLNEAEQDGQQLASERKRLEDAIARRQGEFITQRDAVAVHQPPTPAGQSLFDDWQVLAEWATERLGTMAAERKELGAKGKELAENRREIVERLAASVDPFDLDPDPTSLLEAVAVARSEAEGRLSAMRERQAEQAQLRKQIDEAAADREINAALGQHLAASGFEGWLLNEALDNIVDRATGLLRELSGGSYSLAVADREFAIIDHDNADEQRDVRTLSGGETFLTSLCLALALADSIAELAPIDAPRLESMFLDEGFGTLDTATLDVVAAAIEELASTGRMIGIVTHVRDLAERMPARFEVSKGLAGSSVSLVEV